MSKSAYRVAPQYPSGFHVQELSINSPEMGWRTLDYFFHTQKDAEEYILSRKSEEKQKEEFYKNNPPYRFP